MTDVGLSILEGIKKRNEERARRTETIAHPGDPAQTFVCTLPVDGTAIARLQAAAQKDKSPGWEVRFSRAIVGQYVETIEQEGVGPLEIDGEPVNFRSRSLQSFFGATTAAEAVFAYLGSDAYVARVANDIAAAAGFETDDVSDPTQG